jgi:hypothetical protein
MGNGVRWTFRRGVGNESLMHAHCSALPVSIGTVWSCAFSVGTTVSCAASVCACCFSRSFCSRSSLCRRAAALMYPGCAARHRAICERRRVSLHKALFLISMSLYPASRRRSIKYCSMSTRASAQRTVSYSNSQSCVQLHPEESECEAGVQPWWVFSIHIQKKIGRCGYERASFTFSYT